MKTSFILNLKMSSISKYWEKYRESKKENVADKDSYISYLELQLEKVNQSLRMTQSFNERIENLQSQLNSSEEKTMNLTRLVKLQQHSWRRRKKR